MPLKWNYLLKTQSGVFAVQDYLTVINSNIWTWKQNDILKVVIFLHSAELISVETKLSTVSSDSAGFSNGCFLGGNRLCHSETPSKSPHSQDYFKIQAYWFEWQKICPKLVKHNVLFWKPKNLELLPEQAYIHIILEHSKKKV